MWKEQEKFTWPLMNLIKKNMRKLLVNSSLLSNAERTIPSLPSTEALQPRLASLVGQSTAKGCGFRPRKANNANLQSHKDSMSVNTKKKAKLTTIPVANRAEPKRSPRSDPQKTSPFSPSRPSSTKRTNKSPKSQVFTESLPTA